MDSPSPRDVRPRDVIPPLRVWRHSHVHPHHSLTHSGSELSLLCYSAKTPLNLLTRHLIHRQRIINYVFRYLLCDKWNLLYFFQSSPCTMSIVKFFSNKSNLKISLRTLNNYYISWSLIKMWIERMTGRNLHTWCSPCHLKFVTKSSPSN